jgi:hypothetical protein
MSRSPTTTDHELFAAAPGRRPGRLSPAELRTGWVIGLAFVVAVAALWVVAPPDFGGVHPVSLVASTVGLAVASRIRFDVRGVVVTPSQMAFAALVFIVPPAALPVVVLVAGLAATAPDVLAGRLGAARLPLVMGASWSAVGPAAVLVAAGLTGAAQAGPAVLVAAFAAQLLVGFAVSALRERLLHRVALREQLAGLWVLGVDAAFTPVGVLVGVEVGRHPLALGAIAPLLAIFRLLARAEPAPVGPPTPDPEHPEPAAADAVPALDAPVLAA